jgi:fimbrial chaperone protein
MDSTFENTDEENMILAPVKRGQMAIAVLTALIPFAPAQGMNVQPLVVDMASVGAHAHAVVEIVNDSAAPMPVEVTYTKLDIAVDGKTTQSQAGDEFLVFPPQAVVAAGATQTFRIQWAGEPNIQKSQSFILSVSQIPVKKKTDDSGVQMVFSFGVIVNVAPPGAQSAIKLVSAEPATESGKSGAAITVENPSSTYSYISDAGVVLESGSWRKTINASEMKQKLGYGVVLPGRKRRFFIAEDVPAGAGKITATLNYTPKTAK